MLARRTFHDYYEGVFVQSYSWEVIPTARRVGLLRFRPGARPQSFHWDGFQVNPGYTLFYSPGSSPLDETAIFQTPSAKELPSIGGKPAMMAVPVDLTLLLHYGQSSLRIASAVPGPSARELHSPNSEGESRVTAEKLNVQNAKRTAHSYRGANGSKPRANRGGSSSGRD
jgi:hypothetical protein